LPDWPVAASAATPIAHLKFLLSRPTV